MTTTQAAAGESVEELISAADLMSIMIRSVQEQNICPTHEFCDGSCSGPPLRYGGFTANAPKFSFTAEPSPKHDRPEGPRDQAWVESQKFDRFGYEPLETDKPSIRLLRIKPALYREDVIECDLEEVPLTANPTYTALSYYWGPATFDQAIICNGKVLQITSTLRDALRNYRQDTTDRDGRLWVDAVSINQTDIPEVNVHLLIMRDIYKNAHHVHISLGDVQPGWFLGLDLMLRVSFMFEKIQHQIFRSPGEFQTWGLPPINHMAWQALLYIFSCPWFTRTWILQEVALAGSARVMFGRFAFEWESLVKCFRFVSEQRLSARLKVDHQTMRGVNNMNYILRIRTDRQSAPLPLIQVMDLTRKFMVSNAKDKIFAVWGFTDASDDGFILDYSLPAGTIYRRSALLLIRREYGASMLSYAGRHLQGSLATSIPSWTPDWSALASDFGPKVLSSLRNEPYNAAASTGEAEISFDGDAEAITVRGRMITTIAAVGRALDAIYEDNQAECFLSWHDEAWQIFCQASEANKLRYENGKEAFLRTILADDLYTGNNAIVGSAPILDISLAHERAIDAFKANNVMAGGFEISERVTFQIQSIVACMGRRFATTESGHIGLVPACAVVGDCVVVFNGLTVPFVLRQGDGSQWSVMGEAYVHGLMYGEASEMKLDARDFVLV